MKKFSFYFLLLFSCFINAQLIVDNTTQTPAQLVQNVLVGSGVTPLNIKFNRSVAFANSLSDQVAEFSNGSTTNLGIDAGVLLATGNAQVAIGPNNLPNKAQITTTPTTTDADLTLLTGQVAVNVAVLEFDFVATGLSLNFDFVFASEEYPEWIIGVNDAFGFFLSGPGITGPYLGGVGKNIALIPTTVTGSSNVTIGNVNAISNPLYFVNNGAGTTPLLNPTIQYDGFTVPLRATSNLTCGGTYHIKLAVGNVIDNAWDTAVFVKNFTIPPLVLLDNTGLASNPNVCFGEPVTINSGLTVGTNVFVWRKNSVIIPGESGATLPVTTSGTYELTVTTALGCVIAKDDILIGFEPPLPVNNPVPIIKCTLAAPPYVFNINQNLFILNGQAASDFDISYYDSSYLNALANNLIGLIPNANLGAYSIPTNTSTIWVRIKKNTGTQCVIVKSFTLNANPIPLAPIVISPISYCKNEIVTPLSAPGSNLLWYTASSGGIGNATAPTPNTSATGFTDYYVSQTTASCEGPRSLIKVNVIANPTSPAGTMVQPTCTSPTGSITISSPVGVIFEYSKDAGVSYQSSTVFTGLAANATYTIQVRNTTTGCFSSGTGFVISPATVFAPTPTVFGNNICEGETINLSTPTVLGATYSWTGPNGFSSTDQNPIILNATSEMSGTYNLISTLVIGCPSLPGQVSVTVNNLPTPELEQNGYVCVDSLTNAVLQSFNLDSGLTNAGYTFEWFEIIGNVPNPILGEIQSTIEISTAGVFGVIATNKITGCKSELVSANVGVSSPPVTMDIVTSQYFDNTDSITITVLPIGNYEYKIDDGAYQNSNLFNSVSEGNHTIEVRDINGCGSIYKSTSIVDFPKFFTPNGDGYNDSWNISSLSGKGISKIYIFDRYGKFIKEISPLDNGWDGTINQVNLPASDYWFSVYYEENNISKVFKSHFALKR